MQELRLTEPMVRSFSRDDNERGLIFGGTGSLWCLEMVLEQIARRCCHMGGVRTVQGWRTRYDMTAGLVGGQLLKRD